MLDQNSSYQASTECVSQETLSGSILWNAFVQMYNLGKACMKADFFRSSIIPDRSMIMKS